MRKQEIYDKVCAHLAKQKERAVDAEGNCVYRAEDGKRCAVGCLLPFHVWRKEVKDSLNTGTGVEELLGMSAWAGKNLGRSMAMLEDLQDSHDSEQDAASLRQDLRAIAHRYNIKPGAEQAIKKWNEC